jgi:hypothetical protein
MIFKSVFIHVEIRDCKTKKSVQSMNTFFVLSYFELVGFFTFKEMNEIVLIFVLLYNYENSIRIS